MFCSIEDAWGEKNFTEKPLFKQSDKSEHFTNQEDPKNHTEQMYSKYMELKEMFDGGEPSYSKPTTHQAHQPHQVHKVHQPQDEICVAVDAHIAKCAHCRSKYMGLQQNKYSRSYNQSSGFDFGGIDLNKIGITIKSNKDIVTIFLFGLLVILLLQLFSK